MTPTLVHCGRRLNPRITRSSYVHSRPAWQPITLASPCLDYYVLESEETLNMARRLFGCLITITDPTTAQNFVLNPKSNLATRLVRPSAPPEGPPIAERPQSNVMVNQQHATERSSLGTRTIEGVVVTGKEFVSIIPANSRLGNRDAIEVTFEVWTSDELQLPLLTIVKDPLNGERTQRYVNIQKGIEPDAALFRVPKGYNVVEAGAVRH